MLNRISTRNHLATCFSFETIGIAQIPILELSLSLSHCPFPSLLLFVSLLLFSQDVSHTRTCSRIVTRSNGIHPTSSTRSSRVAAYIRAFPRLLRRSYIFSYTRVITFLSGVHNNLSYRGELCQSILHSHIKIHFISRIARSIFVIDKATCFWHLCAYTSILNWNLSPNKVERIIVLFETTFSNA